MTGGERGVRSRGGYEKLNIISYELEYITWIILPRPTGSPGSGAIIFYLDF